MIVACANCNTRFRLADDRIRPTGTRVRCSRCASVFVVHPPEAGASAAALPELDEPSFDPSFDEVPTRVAQVPPELLAKSRQLDETTQAAAIPPELLAALQGPPDPLADLPQRPFGATSDGFTDVDFGNGLPTQHSAGPGGFTDVDFGSGLPTEQSAGPAGFSDLGFDDALPGGADLDRILPPLQAPGGLLDDDPFARLGPPPPASSPFEDSWVPAVPPAPPSQSGLELDALAGARQQLPSVPPSELTSPSGLDLDLAPSDPRTQRQPPTEPQRTPAPQRGPQPGRAGTNAGEPAQRRKEAAPVAPPQRHGLLRLASGVAVLVTALVAFVIVRNDGAVRLDGAALARAFGLDEASAPDAASELRPDYVSMGHYPLVGGGEAFFVRGTVKNHAGVTRGPGIRVVAELRDASDRVIARGETWAGGVATPEEVAQLRSAADWNALDEKVAAGWAAPLPPGGEAPFLIAFAPAPEAAASSRLRIVAMEGKPVRPAPADAAVVNDP